MHQKRTILFACVGLFVLGVSYIVWANRPVMDLQEAALLPEKAPLTAPSENPQMETVSEPEVIKPETAPAKPAEPEVLATDGPQSFTMTQVQAHASPEDCWAAINGSVYNLTSWIERHPGGSRSIESLCGTDGSARFQQKHGKSSAAQAALVLLKIGDLAE
jgi:cytochrome b involved in lipid metabolism